jgi:urease accessory protein
MGWQGHLHLHYRRQGSRTVALDRHEGPLRALQRLYPEGEAVCHHVLVHPPGGLVGGDRLDIDLRMDADTHAVVTTPGATRFYRSEGEAAIQRTRLKLARGARLEWLPLETLAYDGCLGENHVSLDLDPGAQAMGWDLLALGLPAANAPFQRGSFLQHLQCGSRWLERGRIRANDAALLDGPTGWAGRRMLALLWFAFDEHAQDSLRDRLLAVARDALPPLGGEVDAGVSAPVEGIVVLRALAQRVEPAWELLQSVRAAWRHTAWGLDAHPPRVWST